MKKLCSILLALSIALLPACASNAANASASAVTPSPAAIEETTDTTSTAEANAAGVEREAGQIKITDMMNRSVTLEQPVTSILTLNPGDCEIVYAIGAQELLVGRGSYCDYPEQAQELPTVDSGGETNIEQIVALKPQVLIMSTMTQTEDQVKQLEQAGVKVVISNASDLSGVYTAIQLIGTVTGKDDAANQLIADMQAKFADVKAKAAANADAAAGKTIYYEVSPLRYGLWAAGKGTFMDEIGQMLGLTDIFEDVNGWGQVSEEEVIARNPDYIVTNAMDLGDGSNPVQEIEGRQGWDGISAVQKHEVTQLDPNIITRPGPRLTDAAQALYDFVYSK